MKRYTAKGLELLDGKVKTGILSYFASQDASGVSALRLQFGDLTWLRIQSEMQDLEGWEEVGVLNVELCCAPSDPVRLEACWAQPLQLEILSVEDESVYAESGMVISCSDAGELVAVAADMPFDLALKAPGFSGRFVPDRDLSSYNRVRYAAS